jgi:tetratricopeptide (TPR) repeat protein
MQIAELTPQEQMELLKPAKELVDAGKYDEAMPLLYQLLERMPNSAAALHMIGYVYLMADKQPFAYQMYRRALQIEPNRAEIWNNFGRAADELHRYDESEAAFKKALKLDPTYAPGYANMSVSLINQARYEEALKYAEEAVKLDPTNKNGWTNVGFSSLALQDWRRGWTGYHNAIGGKFRNDVAYGEEPEWDGKPTDCLVVTGEQGIGDEINFAQMVIDAAKDVKTLVYDCHPRLEGMFRRSFAHLPNVYVYGTRKEVAVPWLADHKPTAHISLADLGMFYRDSGDKFPRKAYVKADPERVLQWKSLFDSWGKRPTIGIAWSGGTFLTQSSFREVGVESFRALFDAVDANWVSLEYKDCTEQIAGTPVRWFARGTLPNDYEETAGMVGALDLVIGIHTSALHLAGAMGKRVICLVPEVPQWRYYRDDMPWYPDCRLYRKHAMEPWAAVIARVAKAEFK